jgi:uncharacterized protein (TIGR02597 family)
MKTKITYSLLAAAAACGFAQAQTAYTVPVGYVSLVTPANSDITISPSLDRATELQTSVVSALGSTLTIKAAGVTLNQYAYSAGVQPKTYFVRSVSGGGSLPGQYQTILSNTATDGNGEITLTLESSLAVSAPSTVAIAPYWTLNTLFPAGAGVGSTNDPGEVTSYLLRQDQASTGLNRAPNTLYFYFADPGGEVSGWYNNDDLGAGPQNDQVIYPDEFYLIRNLTGSPVTATLTGTVPSVAPATNLIQAASDNDNYLANPVPVDQTLEETGLRQSGAYTPTSDPGEVVDYVLLYDDLGTGINKAPSKVYFYFADPGQEVSGWYDNDDLGAGPQTGKLVKAGNGIIVRKKGGTPGGFLWSNPLPYSISQ